MKSSEVKIFGVILVIAIILVGFAMAPIFLSRTRLLEIDTPKPQPNVNRKLLVANGAFMKGDPKAATTIVVFSDFECPSCKEGLPAVDEILGKHSGKVNTVFRHFQVKPQHVHSRLLSRAAEAAGEQGQEKFWEMHDVLFDKQADLSGPVTEEQALRQIREYAKAMHLDMIRFDATMAKKNDKRFDEDNEVGANVLHLTGTPTYFVIDPQGKVIRYDSTAGLKEWARTTLDGEKPDAENAKTAGK